MRWADESAREPAPPPEASVRQPDGRIPGSGILDDRWKAYRWFSRAVGERGKGGNSSILDDRWKAYRWFSRAVGERGKGGNSGRVGKFMPLGGINRF